MSHGFKDMVTKEWVDSGRLYMKTPRPFRPPVDLRHRDPRRATWALARAAWWRAMETSPPDGESYTLDLSQDLSTLRGNPPDGYEAVIQVRRKEEAK